MHLDVRLTTTSTRKRKVRITRAQQEEFERGCRERNKRLKEIGLPKETLEQYIDWVHGKVKKEKRKTLSNETDKKTTPTKNQETEQNTNNDTITNSKARVVPWITGPCKTKQTPTYTGSKIIGVAVLHKSCMQPVFSQEEAIDIARMRR